MAEFVTLVSTQGLPIVIVSVLLVGIVKGIPKLFSWVAKRLDEIIDVYKSFIQEQVRTMAEIRDESREIYESNRNLIEMVVDVTGKVDVIEESVEEMKEDVRIIRDNILEHNNR